MNNDRICSRRIILLKASPWQKIKTFISFDVENFKVNHLHKLYIA